MMSVSTEHKCSGNFIFINFKSKSFLYQKKIKVKPTGNDRMSEKKRAREISFISLVN